jgi:hypothetical protein
MKRMLSAATTLLVLGAIGPGLASATPTPSYTVTCGPTGFAQATWQRAKLSQVTFEWVATTGSFDPTSVPVSRTPPKGLVTAGPRGAGSGPTSVTATFTHADGSAADQVTVNCG